MSKIPHCIECLHFVTEPPEGGGAYGDGPNDMPYRCSHFVDVVSGRLDTGCCTDNRRDQKLQPSLFNVYDLCGLAGKHFKRKGENPNG